MNSNPTVLQISRDAVAHNLRFFRSRLGDKTKLLAVIKASGYGSDAIAMGKFLESEKVDYFAVAYADEGIALREAGIRTPILVLHPQANNLHLMFSYGLEPNLYSKKILTTFLGLAREQKTENYPVHLKFNTGLNRLGFREADLDYLHTTLSGEGSVQIRSIFSHLMASEDERERPFTEAQIREFTSIGNRFELLFGFRPMMHMSNTSGILRYPEAHFDMVRLGLGLYGFANDRAITSQLKNVLTLKSVISQIHEIPENANVGYNRGFTSTRAMRTATLPLGHADGIPRSLGHSKIHVKVKGQKAFVIGNVCMDMIMIDVTDIPCEEGDEVILFDSQDMILEMAKQNNTISYEVITALSPRIKREFV